MKMKTPGRPTRASEASTAKRSFRLTERESEILSDYCWRYEQTPSQVIRDCLNILGVIPDW